MRRIDQTEQAKPPAKHEVSNAIPPADGILQDIAERAAQVADTAIGLVTFLDDTTQWIIARFGVETDRSSREAAFCAWAVHNPEVMWVEDALLDERFCDNPFVQGEPNVRFYAGAPFSAKEGMRIGTVCVLDDRPRAYDPQLEAHLQSLAAQVSEHLRVCAMVSPSGPSA